MNKYILSLVTFFLIYAEITSGLRLYTYPPFAHVYIDKKFYGYTPIKIPDLKGKIDLKIILDGYENIEKTINLEANKINTIYLELTKNKPKMTTRPKTKEIVREIIKEVPAPPTHTNWAKLLSIGLGCLLIGVGISMLIKNETIVIRR